MHHVAKDECGVQGGIMGGTMGEERGRSIQKCIKVTKVQERKRGGRTKQQLKCTNVATEGNKLPKSDAMKSLIKTLKANKHSK